MGCCSSHSKSVGGAGCGFGGACWAVAAVLITARTERMQNFIGSGEWAAVIRADARTANMFRRDRCGGASLLFGTRDFARRRISGVKSILLILALIASARAVEIAPFPKAY